MLLLETQLKIKNTGKLKGKEWEKSQWVNTKLIYLS